MDKRATTTAGGGETAERMSFFAVSAMWNQDGEAVNEISGEETGGNLYHRELASGRGAASQGEWSTTCGKRGRRAAGVRESHSYSHGRDSVMSFTVCCVLLVASRLLYLAFSSHASLSLSLSLSRQRNKATNKISFYFDKDTEDKSSGEMLALLLLFRFALGSELIPSYPQFINTPLIPQSKKLFFFFILSLF